MTIRQYTPQHQQEWDSFVASCCNATFLHLRNYMDYHAQRFADSSLMAYDSHNRLLAILPANRRDNVLYTHQGLTYGGWLHEVKHFDVTVMLDLFNNMLAWAKAQGITRIVYKAVPHIYHQYSAEEDLYALFRHNAQLVECSVSAVVPLDDPFPFDRGNKSAINVATRAGVNVQQSNEWQAYWQLLGDVLKARFQSAPVHSLEEIQLLHSRFPEQIRLYTASLNGEIIAGVVIFDTGRVMRAQYIAAGDAGRENKALALLFQFLLNEAAARGCRYFDFGTSNAQGGHILNEGLVRQKNRFGARAHVFNTFELTL